MDCAKGTALEGLYDDLMVDILSRVPVKDLCRSKCVSKPWRDLIANPLHRKKLPQTLEGFFHFHGGAGGHQTYGKFTSLSGRGESAPPVDPSFSFVTAKLPGVVLLALLDSCNGLLLFLSGCTLGDKFGYIVCNPATEELVTVPASSASCPPPPPLQRRYYVAVDGEEGYAHTFLMFDPAVSSHFHLVHIWENTSVIQVETVRFHLVHIWENRSVMEVQTVHSYSSETRAWSDRSSKWKRGEKGGEWGLWGKVMMKFTLGRALVNGLLHFLAFDVEKREDLIVAVDGEGKTCRIIGWHGKDVETLVFIGQSQDRLHCIGVNLQSQQGTNMHYTRLSIWVLEDYDTQEWILKHNVSSSQFFEVLSRPLRDFGTAAIHPDHNSIILIQHWNQKLVSYNMDSEELRDLRTLGKGYLLLTPYAPCFMESSVLATAD